jgi:CubicO group peptidase (beta-lactamase class C family)
MKEWKYASKDAPVITIRHLLTHSAGFPEDNPWGDRQLDVSDDSLRALLRQGVSFSNSPGTHYEYSNLGFTILGHIIRQVSGQSYEEYITTHILRPLGMTHTYWEYSQVPVKELALGYRWLNNGWVEQPMLHDGAWGAMGGMITTLEDFARYTAFQLSAWPASDVQENNILKRSSLREMQQPWVFNNLNPGSGTGCAVVSFYGYGLRWTRDCKGRTMIMHSGGLPGFGSNWTILPDYGIGIICFGNVTYAPAAAINTRALDALIRLAKLSPRPVPVSPILQQRKKELLALLPDWRTGTDNPAFAANFFLDNFPDSLRKEAGRLFRQAGKITGTGELEAENNLRGSFLLQGEQADIRVWFSLSPENPARIQDYEIRLIAKDKKD